MPGPAPGFDALDARLTRWMARHGVGLLRGSLGVVFLWFGLLKFFPGASPAEDLAARTVSAMTFGAVGAGVSLPALAVWECAVGAGLLAGRFLRATLALLWLQMAGTLAPLLLFPAECFARFPFAPTLEGQYIVKNAVLVSAAIVVGATVRGGDLVAEADALALARRREDEARA